jgi:uncharacterized phage protein (TIGR01671 family)
VREIEFRGKDETTKEWVHGNYINTGTRKIIDGYAEADVALSFYHDVIPETIGQYTGLKDTEGRKIFEGDIILYDGIEREIKYCTNNACYRAFGIGKSKMFSSPYLSGWVSNGEIIGNIHDTESYKA